MTQALTGFCSGVLLKWCLTPPHKPQCSNFKFCLSHPPTLIHETWLLSEDCREKKTTNTPGLMFHIFLLSPNVVMVWQITPFSSFPVSQAPNCHTFRNATAKSTFTNWQYKGEKLWAEPRTPLNPANTKESYPELSETGQTFWWECLWSECRGREHIEVTVGLDSSPRRFSSDHSHQHGNIAKSKKKWERYWERNATSNLHVWAVVHMDRKQPEKFTKQLLYWKPSPQTSWYRLLMAFLFQST